MTAERQDLLTALSLIQNHPACVNQDIMTFAGFMTNDEVRQHIDRYVGRIADFNIEAAQKPARKSKKAA